MKIQVVYNTHPLRQLTRRAGEEIELAEPGDLRSLLKLLEDRYGGSFGIGLYDAKRDRLGTAVLIDSRGARSLEEPLRNGGTVNFIMLATGG